MVEKTPYSCEKINYYDKLRKKIPEHIHFGESVLRIPTLTELGIQSPLHCISHVDYLVSEASWVDRGDPLVKIILNYYENRNKPGAFWKTDKIFSHIFLVKSPSPGLVVDFRAQHTRSFENGSKLAYGEGLIREDYVLPVLLLPEERIVDHESAPILSTNILTSINEYWKINVHNCGSPNDYKIVRLGDISNDLFLDGFISGEPEEKISSVSSICSKGKYQKWEVISYKKHLESYKSGMFKRIISNICKEEKYDFQPSVVARAKLSFINLEQT